MIEGKKVEDMSETEIPVDFLFQIVNNANNGVDVDKWDYFIRDTHACGIQSNFDKERAIAMVRVCEVKVKGETANVLSFPIKDEINLYNMYGLRYTLHSKVLQHKVFCCVHEMIADVLKYADNTKILKYKGQMLIPKECREHGKTDQYCLMDDRLIHLIYNTGDSDDNITEAQKIIKRIQRKKVYQCIEEKPLSKKESKHQTENKAQEINAEEIEVRVINETMEQIAANLYKHLKIYSVQQSESNDNKDKKILGILKKELQNKKQNEIFRIKLKVIDYGSKDNNPIKDVYFYEKWENIVIDYKENDSPMIPKCFEAKGIQIICTLPYECCKAIKQDKIKDAANVAILIESIPGLLTFLLNCTTVESIEHSDENECRELLESEISTLKRDFY